MRFIKKLWVRMTTHKYIYAVIVKTVDPLFNDFEPYVLVSFKKYDEAMKFKIARQEAHDGECLDINKVWLT